MRYSDVFGIVGKFLKVFSLVLLVPVLPVFVLGELFSLQTAFFVCPSGISFLLGFFLDSDGSLSPGVTDAMVATVLCWLLAVVIGSFPFWTYLSPASALFESAAGLTTTGMTVFTDISNLPISILFWRAFSQWIGGLGVLTFFVAILGKSGGVTRRLYSAETGGSSSASIHTSVSQSVKAALTAYTTLTAFVGVLYFVFGMGSTDALLHAFSTVSTGGFSTSAQNFSQFSDVLKVVTVFTMFFSGANMVLVYSAFRGKPSLLLNSDEFKLYFKFVLAMFFAFILSGYSVLDALFTSSSVVSTTGFTTAGIASLSVVFQFLVLLPLLVGGTVGSTAGGIKIFRLKVIIEVIKQKSRSYYLPDSAVNKPVVEDDILDYDKVYSAVSLVFLWISATLLLSVITAAYEPMSFAQTLSGSLSVLGNVGPYFAARTAELAVVTKLAWVLAMILGRLEMLPLLTIFNIAADKN